MDLRSEFFLLQAVLVPILLLAMLAESMEVLPGEQIFIFLDVVFILYTFVCLRQISRLNRNGLFSYAAIFMICQFVGQIFIGNFSYLLGSELHNSWHYMNKSMLLCFLSVFALTASVHTTRFAQWGRRLSCRFWPSIHLEQLYLKRCFFLYLLSFAVTIFMVSKGMYGFADADTLEQVNPYASLGQYLKYLAAGTSLVLYLLFYEYLSRPTMVKRLSFLLAFSLEFGLSLTSGMKKDTLIMFACLFMLYYLVRRRVNLWILLVMALAVFGLYQFVDAYRSALLGPSFNGSRLDAFMNVLSAVGNDQGLYSDRMEAGDVLAVFFARLSLTDALSLIVEYKDVVGLGPEDPTFLLDLLMVPFTVFLPRFLLPFKSMSTYGRWVTHTVMGLPETVISSSYVTVEGFFYLGGGVLAVGIGFFLLGAVLNFCSAFCRLEERNPIFIVIFFLTALNLVEPATPIDMVTSVVRATIIYTMMGCFLIGMKGKGV